MYFLSKMCQSYPIRIRTPILQHACWSNMKPNEVDQHADFVLIHLVRWCYLISITNVIWQYKCMFNLLSGHLKAELLITIYIKQLKDPILS